MLYKDVAHFWNQDNPEIENLPFSFGTEGLISLFNCEWREGTYRYTYTYVQSIVNCTACIL